MCGAERTCPVADLDLDAIEARIASVPKAYGMPDSEDAETLALVAEVRRLRALPVIATCGDCSHFDGDSQRERGGGVCCHGFRGDFVGDTNEENPPPSWCPLRGKR